MNNLQDYNAQVSRRQFFRKGGTGLGAAALSSLLPREALAIGDSKDFDFRAIAPKAKRAIYLSMVGAPSQMETWDPKPHLRSEFKKDLTGYLKSQGERLTGMTAGQSSFPLAPSAFDFEKKGQSGIDVSELFPYTGKVVDDLCVIRSMYTEAINHEPANQLCFTGNQVAGKASLGSWLSYGLGSMNENLPSFVVLHARHSNPAANVQAISNRLWGSGYLPGKYAGVELRSVGDPVLYLKDAPGIDRETRRHMLDGLAKLNQESLELVGDPNIQTRILQYEMAFRMQASVPELTDLSSEPESSFELYGEDSRKPGTFAASALMGRRLLERGVRFVQVFHRGWDQHGSLPQHLPDQCRDVDQGCYALISDLKQRGMLDDTLVIWGGEFGRTIYSQGTLNEKTYGRDHHPRAFSLWMAGGGIKGGMVHGATDEYGYNIIEKPVHIRDLHATILHQLGVEHERMTYKYQGLDQRLTGVEHAKVIQDILA
ncbi:MAG: DUF1501 domain-containing protein [Roseibacillus sp.]